MVREFRWADLDRVMALWLDVNIEAHHFISKEYWLGKFEIVKEAIPKAQVYVYENQDGIQGFVGLDDGYIAGIFVSRDHRSKNIGKVLLDKCKSANSTLSLKVYKKNTRAIAFYLREGFIIDKQTLDEETSELENRMAWSK